MKRSSPLLLTIILLIVGMGIAFSFSNIKNESSLQEDLESVEQETSESNEAFDKMMAVITHKRCLNCHPAGDRPRQGEDSHIHNFNVQRGPDDHGVGVLTCNTCHQEENNMFSGVPGAPHWAMAPSTMFWEGLSKKEIAESITDPQRNGGRSLAEIVKHMTEDKLVLWAFDPGVDNEGNPREKPPISKEEFIEAVKTWAAAGAPIPEN